MVARCGPLDSPGLSCAPVQEQSYPPLRHPFCWVVWVEVGVKQYFAVDGVTHDLLDTE